MVTSEAERWQRVFAERPTWDGEADYTADDLMRRLSRPELARRADERTRLQAAVEFLRQLQADGPLPTGMCYLRARIEGIAQRSLQRAPDLHRGFVLCEGG